VRRNESPTRTDDTQDGRLFRKEQIEAMEEQYEEVPYAEATHTHAGPPAGSGFHVLHGDPKGLTYEETIGATEVQHLAARCHIKWRWNEITAGGCHCH
jgi:hypothetical protein